LTLQETSRGIALDRDALRDGEHERILRRVEIASNDVTHVLDEERIGGEHKTFAPIRLDAEVREIALHGVLLILVLVATGRTL
jgi:hypothetical protein